MTHNIEPMTYPWTAWCMLCAGFCAYTLLCLAPHQFGNILAGLVGTGGWFAMAWNAWR